MRAFMIGCLLASIGGLASAEMLDLTKAVVVASPQLVGPERKAVEMLVDEVWKRAYVRWDVVEQPPAGVPAIEIRRGPNATPAEGYHLKSSTASVLVEGNDPRGLLFGVGRLLRELRMTRWSVQLPGNLNIETAPAYPMRGHQFGYRPKVNTYDGWTPAMYEQYIRDLIVFGANCVEIMPPKTDDAPNSPHFTLPQIDMMAAVSQIADDYGIDLWIWYPAMDRDYSKPETVEKALAEWGEVFARLPRIDAVFVPGGDPGHTQPKYLMALLEKETEVLHKTHPNAQMWMSPQSFDSEWMAEFLDIMKTESAWLTGLVYGPQNRNSLPELRAAVPAKYPIRHYPDITHSIRCQFAVPDWDVAYAITEEREVINPRPLGMAAICRQFDEYTPGFLTYSEGVNDDFNKALWSALGWDPDTDVNQVLRGYARYFVEPGVEEKFAQILLGLEKNWQGPLLSNEGVDQVLELVRQVEKEVTPHALLSWRYQQAVYRAYYDAFLRGRLGYEQGLEHLAMEALREAPESGPVAAMEKAEDILEQAVDEPVPVIQELRGRVFEMAEALYQSIRMQHSVPRYRAIDAGRGGNLDLIDRPLNNRLWLQRQFKEIRELKNKKEQLERLDTIVNWTDPGPGGFYDDLGDVTNQPHLVRLDVQDPEFRTTPRIGFDYEPNYRMSWVRFAETIYDTPLNMKYEGLDPNSEYKVRVTYNGEDRQVKLSADGLEVHPFLKKPSFPQPIEFDVPKQATADGNLTLSFQQEPGARGAGRGCQVAEVWLIKK